MWSLFLCLVLSLTNSAPVPLIIDTDIGGGGCMDVDDVAALCMAHALADNGEADLLAVMQNTQPPKCAGVISVLNHYYGRDDLPIGAYRGTDLSSDSPKLSYVEHLTDNWPSRINDTSQVPDAVDVYRSVLANAQTNSVAISSIGILTNLEALLKSGPDQHSPLSGYDLVAQKVKLLAVMGGKYPSSQGQGPECNLCGCAHADHASSLTASRASSYVAAHMPPQVTVVYSGFEIGIEVQSGGVLSTCTPKENPCRAAFIDYEGGPNKSRYSWDPLSTLAAVRGVEAASCEYCSDCDGHNSVDASTGDNKWVRGSASNETYLLLKDAKAAGDAIDQLLCQPPKHH